MIDRHVEELVRLPDSFLCYTPSPEAGPVCPTPALSNGFVTFGSFNNLAKVMRTHYYVTFSIKIMSLNILITPDNT